MGNAQSLSALLDQTGWIHALARQLVADPHLAADLAQDTTVDALLHEPDGARPLRGWLATVMRNKLAKLRRGESNRTSRERTARRGELAPAALDVVEKAETHRNVVLAVLALDEPYRSTLLMRFFEQLSYDDIARRTGVTRASVNSRITRALEQLRQRLENTYGGDRRALCLALTPLAKLPIGVATTTTTILGLKTMHVAIGTAAATLLAATVSVGVYSGGREPKEPGALPLTASVAAPAEEVELRLPLTIEPVAEPAARVEVAQPEQKQKHKHREKDETDENTWRTELFHTMNVAPTVESLSVNTAAGDVEVLASASGQLEIQAKVSARLGRVQNHELTQIFEDHVDVYEEDGQLKIEDKHSNNHSDGGWNVSFVLSVPKRMSLNANTASGDVTLRTGQGEISANTASGDVLIQLGNEILESVNANTASGDVVIDTAGVKKGLNANTASGDVMAHVGEGASPGKVQLNTASGDVLLVVPASISGSFHLETVGGDIELPRAFGIPVTKDARGQLVARGAYGSGGGKYKLSSASGDLEVRFGNALPADSE